MAPEFNIGKVRYAILHLIQLATLYEAGDESDFDYLQSSKSVPPEGRRQFVEELLLKTTGPMTKYLERLERVYGNVYFANDIASIYEEYQELCSDLLHCKGTNETQAELWEDMKPLMRPVPGESPQERTKRIGDGLRATKHKLKPFLENRSQIETYIRTRFTELLSKYKTADRPFSDDTVDFLMEDINKISKNRGPIEHAQIKLQRPDLVGGSSRTHYTQKSTLNSFCLPRAEREEILDWVNSCILNPYDSE